MIKRTIRKIMLKHCNFKILKKLFENRCVTQDELTALDFNSHVEYIEDIGGLISSKFKVVFKDGEFNLY